MKYFPSLVYYVVNRLKRLWEGEKQSDEASASGILSSFILTSWAESNGPLK